jgi:transcription elongation factor GreA
MSLKDSSGAGIAGPGAAGVQLPSRVMPEDAQNAISPEGYAKAKAELEHLTQVRRPAIVAAIKAAREEGDLSENAEYHAAREEQGLNEARIRNIESLLASAEVVEADANGAAAGVVGVGSTVSFRDEASERVTEVTLVHRLEADTQSGKLSADSPIAQALLGAREGATVEVETPGGTKRLAILSVS